MCAFGSDIENFPDILAVGIHSVGKRLTTSDKYIWVKNIWVNNKHKKYDEILAHPTKPDCKYLFAGWFCWTDLIIQINLV